MKPIILDFLVDATFIQDKLYKRYKNILTIKLDCQKAQHNLNKVDYFIKRRNSLLSKVPNFWIKCFSRHQFIKSWIIKEDYKLFSYLNKFEINEFNKLNEKTNKFKVSYTLKFLFNNNDYFNQTQIIKHYDGYKTSMVFYKNHKKHLTWKNEKFKKKINGKNLFFIKWLINTKPIYNDMVSWALINDINFDPLL